MAGRIKVSGGKFDLAKDVIAVGLLKIPDFTVHLE